MRALPFSGWLAACVLLLASGTAGACRVTQSLPHPEAIGHFGSVHAVEVTGIHLTSYAAFQAKVLDYRDNPPPPRTDDQDSELDEIFITSATAPFEVDLLVDRTLRGSKGKRSIKVTLGGCGVRHPRLMEKGFVFIPEQGDGFARAVWESDGEAYATWAIHFGIAKPEPAVVETPMPWQRHCSVKGMHPADMTVLPELEAAAASCKPIDACRLACIRSGCAMDAGNDCDSACSAPDALANPGLTADAFAARTHASCAAVSSD